MSPEQAGGKSALVDGRCDVYSLAATLYELLCLRPAFDGDSVPAILTQIENEEVISPSRLCADVPRDLETVIAKAMSKHRDDRYETASEFADDLRRVIAGEPTVARPLTVLDHGFRIASRHRTIVMLTTLFLIIGSLGMAIVTVTFATLKQNAEFNAMRAQRNENLACGAVDRLGSKMAELLADVPAADPVRRRLLMETLDYYQQFVAMANRDPQLQEDLALTFGKIGSLQAELNETEVAIESLRRSEHLFASIVQASGADRTTTVAWSTSQNNLAEALARAGQFEDAARYYARAIKTLRQLSASGPSREVSLRLATTLNNLGLLLTQIGSPDEAESVFTEVLALLELDAWQGLPADPNDNEPIASYPTETQASILCNLSSLLTTTSPDQAVVLPRRALAAQTDALEQDRTNARLASQVVVTLNELGAAQSHAGEVDAAMRTFQRAIEIGDQLLVRLPENPRSIRNLLMSWNHLGLCFARQGELDESALAFERALEHGRKLQAMCPDHAEAQSSLAGVLHNLGFLHQKRGHDADAVASLEEAIDVQSEAALLAPGVLRYQELIKKHQDDLHSLVQLNQGAKS